MATMATPMLSIPAPDDTMEISSDAGRDDHDVDIDLMSQHGDQEIDYMLEDADEDQQVQDAPNPSNDDLMFDDVDEITYVEEPMQDDELEHTEPQNDALDLDVDIGFQHTDDTTLLAIPDTQQLTPQAYNEPEEETLIDYDAFSDTEEQLPEITYENEQAVSDQVGNAEHNGEQGPADLASYPEVNTETAEQEADQQPNALGDGENDTAIQDINPTRQRSGSAPSLHYDHESSDEPASNIVPSSNHVSPPVAPVDEESRTVNDVSEEQTVSHEESVPAETSEETQQDGQNVPDFQLQELHAVTVVYNDVPMSLFPPYAGNDAETFLLADSMVAHGTLLDFFQACRRVLAQDIDDGIELEIYCENLDLTVAEDSIHCMTTSLAQIIEVYVNLMRNDGVENLGPLSIYLTTKSRFSAQLTNLFKAASDRKGLSQLNLFQEQSFEADDEVRQWEGAESDGQEQEAEETVPSQDQVNETVAETEKTEIELSGNDAAQNGPPADSEEGPQVEQLHTELTKVQPNDDGNEQEPESLEQPDLSARGYEDHQEEEYAEPHDEEQKAEDLAPIEYDDGDLIEYAEDAEDAEEGDGGSSGSSTVQGEIHPVPPRQYTPSSDEDDWLIDYSDDEDSTNDASSDTLQVIHEEIEGTTTDYDALTAGTEAVDNVEPASGHHETYAEPSELPDEQYDGSTQDGGVPDQEWNDEAEWGIDFGDGQLEGNDNEQAGESWDLDDDQADTTGATTAPLGSFQVPEESLDDEDEITYDEDEDDFTASIEHPKETDHERSPKSPLGKRSREDDDGDGLINGSDQESKRLKQ